MRPPAGRACLPELGTGQHLAGGDQQRRAPFAAVVVGAGMYGAYCAAKLYRQHPGKRMLLRTPVGSGRGRWRVRFNSDWAGYDPQFGHQDSYDTDARPGGMDGMPCVAGIGLGPYSAVILSQDD